MKKLINIMLILCLLLLTTSCKKEKQSEIELKKENNVPKQLILILDNIDKTEEELLKLKEKTESTEEVELKKEKQQMIEKIKTEDESKKEDKTDKSNKAESKPDPIETHNEKIFKAWSNLEKRVEKIHEQVNNYKVKAVEDKANEKKIEQFEENLNNLTIFVKNKDFLNSFISNNQLYNDYSYFLSLYKSYDSEILKLKYEVDNIYIYALKNEWDETLEGMNKIDNQYSEVLREFNKQVKEKHEASKEDKEKEEKLEKLKFSIDSLGQSINKKDIKLLEIKRDVVVSDIEKVKK